MKLAQSPSSSTNADSFIDTQTAIIRPREEEEEGGKRGEKRKERGFSLHGLYIYIYIHETFSCSREADTGREGIKQTGRQDADGGGREEGARVGLNACGCLNRTQPRCSAISRVPVAPEMLPNSLHLRPALYSPGNALSPFLKVQEAARTAFPSLSLQPSLLSLSLSLVRIFSISIFFLDLDTEQLPSEGRERKGTRAFRHGIGIVARMRSHDDDGGNVEERDSNEEDFYASALVRIDAHRAPSPLGGSGSYEEITSGYEKTLVSFFFFFFLVFQIVLSSSDRKNLE